MPPRPSKRTVRSSRTTRNTRGQSTKTPEITGSSSDTAPERETESATATRTSEPTPFNAFQQSIAAFFAQGQKSTIGHRMLVNNLRQLFDQCIAGTGISGSTTGVKGPAAEKLFCHEFCQILNRVLVIRKGEVAADRCLRLADSFVKNLIGGKTKKKPIRKKAKDKSKHKEKEKDGDIVMEDVGEDGDDNDAEREEFVETEATHAVLRILHHLVPLTKSRTKWVRYRTAQFLALLLSNTLSTFPFDHSHISLTIFLNIWNALLDRLQDKESIVRVQAVIGLVRLMEMGISGSSDSEDESITAEPHDKVEKVLIESMQTDPSADVRRTVLYNLTPTPTTFEYFIERARDVDTSTRRAVFRRLLTTFDDFRLMTLVLRENLLRWGFNDSDKSVRLVAKKVFSYRWLKDAEGDVLELLERLDVVSEGVEQGSKYMAMMGFWEERTDLLSTIDLNSHEFWENLTPESIFLARTFNDHYRSISSRAATAIAQDRLPELSKMTDYLKKYLNKYIVVWQDPDIQESAADIEFIIMQLLKITCSMDFSDEVGRRRLFALLRECLGIEELSDPITALVCDGVRKLSHGEYDFSLIVVEAIAQIRQIIIDARQEREMKRDSDDDSASFHTANDDIENGNADLALGQNEIGLSTSNRRKTGDYFGFDNTNLMEEVDQAFEENQSSLDPAVVVRELSLNIKCLHLAQCVLERVKATNGDLFSMIPTCIVPAVRSHAPLAREGGIRCLGLFGILDINLAKLYLDLICYCLDEGHKELKILALQIISDFLVTHRMALFENASSALKPRELYIKVATATTSDAGEEVQCLAFMAVCKFMLARIILESQFLKMLAISYFKTSEVVKPTVHSVLKTFLPLFCHSSTKNAKMMARISVSTFHTLLNIRANLAEDSELKMLKPAQIAARFIRWTDPRETIAPASQSGGPRVVSGVLDATLHAIVARKALEHIASRGCAAEERKLLLNEFLGKCYLPIEAGMELLQDVYEAVVYAIEASVVTDATGKGVLNKVEASVAKLLTKLQESMGNETEIPGKDGNEDTDEDEDGRDSEALPAHGNDEVGEGGRGKEDEDEDVEIKNEDDDGHQDDGDDEQDNEVDEDDGGDEDDGDEHE